MDDKNSLKYLYPAQVNIIRDYLRSQLGAGEIRESEDVLRDGLIFQSHRGEKPKFRVFISHEFLSDFQPFEAMARLVSFNAADQLRKLQSGETLFITTQGTFVESTQGPTLRETSKVFDSVLPTSEARKELYQRVYSIKVDDQPLGDIPSEMRGDRNLYIWYSDDFANTLGAVYLLDAAGYRDFELIHRTEDPLVNFEVILTTYERAYLSFERAFDQKARADDAMREEINVELRRAMRENTTVRNALKGNYIQINMPRVPQQRQESRAIVTEILDFATSRAWADSEDQFRHFDSQRYPLLSGLQAQFYIAHGPTALSVQQGAHFVDPMVPFAVAAEIVSRKSVELQSSQFRPLWLGVSLADLMVFPTHMDWLDPANTAMFNIENTPFDKIIIGSAEKVGVWSKNHRDS